MAMLAAIGVAGCSGGGAGSSQTAVSVNSGLDQYSDETGASAATPQAGLSRDDIASWLAQDAEVLPSLADGRTPDSPKIGTQTPILTNPSPALTVETEIGDADGSGAERAPTRSRHAGASDRAPPSSSMTTRDESPGELRTRLIAELAGVLRRQVRESAAPLREYAALAALELLEPGVAPDPTSIPTLTPREVELLDAWRDLFRRADEELSNASSDIGALATVVAELSTRMQEWETLAIREAMLCSRVDGFGVYTPLAGPKMLAGRRNPAIVYVELEHFTHRSATGADGEPGYIVELGQELSLYHDADGLLAWRQPEQQVKDFSRNRRRDFFIVQRIDLPETLSVGSYRLKITMRDKATGAVAERILPIELVADVALVRAQ